MEGKKRTYEAENLRSLRLGAGYSQKGFTEEINETWGIKLHPTTLKRLEEGSQPMKVEELYIFSNFFKVEIDKFVNAPIDQSEIELKRKFDELRLARSLAWRGASRYKVKLQNAKKFLEDDKTPPPSRSEYVRKIKEISSADEKLIPELEKIFTGLKPDSQASDNGEG